MALILLFPQPNSHRLCTRPFWNLPKPTILNLTLCKKPTIYYSISIRLAWCLAVTILPGYIAPLSMNNTGTRSLEVELPYLDLYVNYRKNNSSLAETKFIELLTRYFIWILTANKSAVSPDYSSHSARHYFLNKINSYAPFS